MILYGTSPTRAMSAARAPRAMVSAWLPMNTPSPTMRTASPMAALVELIAAIEASRHGPDRRSSFKKGKGARARPFCLGGFLLEHDLSRNPVPTFRDLALLLRLQAHEVGHQGIEAPALAGMDIDAADLLDHPLQALQLLEPEQQRVVLHEPGGVEERTRCRGLLLAADQVGLRRPLRLHHLVHQLADLARQDHVLHAELGHLDASLGEALAHECAQLRVERVLGREHLGERAPPDRLADRELPQPVEPCVHVRDRADRALRIDAPTERGESPAEGTGGFGRHPPR